MIRYSDEELQEFKQIITNRLVKAREDWQWYQDIICRKHDNGAEDTSNLYKNLEDGASTQETEQLIAMAGRQAEFIVKLEQALVRIENKTYGVCRVTGELIDRERLKVVPHATLSVKAKKYLNNQ